MLPMQHITKKIQSEVPRRSIALRIMPPLGWGEFELCAMRNVKCCVLNVSNYF